MSFTELKCGERIKIEHHGYKLYIKLPKSAVLQILAPLLFFKQQWV